MKTIACLLLACSPLFTFGASADTSTSTAKANATPIPATRIIPGLHRSAVLARMGAPSETYSSNVWIYLHVAFAPGSPAAEGRDALVVQFTDDRVSQIVVTGSNAVKTYLAQVRRNAAQRAGVSR